jgi:hypothetical protein
MECLSLFLMDPAPSFLRSRWVTLLGCSFLALPLWALATVATASTGAVASRPGDEIRYSRDIRPILSESCFLCHGPDISTREADLRLDSFGEATRDLGGYAAIVPGDVEESELWYRLTTDLEDDAMPPHGSNMKMLTAEQKDLLRRWIEQGAEYESHWAFETPLRPGLPVAGGEFAQWPRNPIDNFLLAGMEDAGITPSPPASRAKLLRRVFLDLTGLPPTPEELDAFLTDTRPDAYERIVERLLNEEPYISRYAERMATPWLDAARYADTNGIHMDAGRQMWAWRDWVLRALHDNMPFDRFVVEQLAGDLLPEPTLDQKVASGFHRNHVITDEGGAINEEYLVEYAADRTATTGAVFMGLTVHCARCHDHKFDPVSQEEYYSLFSFFNSNEEPGLYTQEQDANRAFEPFLQVPTEEQASRQAETKALLEALRAEMEEPTPADALAFDRFLAQAQSQFGVTWAGSQTMSAISSTGEPMTVFADGSALATGPVPDREDHTITLRTDGTGLRLLLVEALQDPSLFENRVGRAANGNAVVSYLEAEAISLADPELRESLNFTWAWADVEQQNLDFDVVNLLDASPDRGWAVAAHEIPGGRHALLLSDKPFGFKGGTELRVTLQYRSIYAKHSLGRVRLTPGAIDTSGLAALPVADSRWYGTWPYTPPKGEPGYDHPFGPEVDSTIDFAKKYAPDEYSWVFVPQVIDDEVNNVLPAGQKVSFVGRRLFVPSARRLDLSLGSDDGIQVYLDGDMVFENRVDRGAAPDQERITVSLSPGVHTIVLKIINTGGPGGMYWKALPPLEELQESLVWSLAPQQVLARGGDDLQKRVSEDWRTLHSPGYRDKLAQAEELQVSLAEITASIPLTMVMSELEMQRETFVLMRGAYDLPDKERPVLRGVPAALGALPEDAPQNRLGLAMWLTAPENPLLARVTVNRFWEMVFGTGIVTTPADFGLQGAWPSHPELLDWLAVEFQESGWDVRAIIKLMVLSEAYRQESRMRPEVTAVDPGNHLLASYPRRRLGAEEIRDQALYVAGLLVEEFGGPSVKPYQPEGLWQEVAMPQSNTRSFARGAGADLWRRSLYTYWKRAVPPPSLLTFDAPTREFCVTSRSTTNTPLQALVLWNDEQYVEAARMLAQRTLLEDIPLTSGSESLVDPVPWRVARMFERCTGRVPEPEEVVFLREAFDAFEQRYREAPEDAAKLLEAGVALRSEAIEASTLAAWTMLANAMLALDETITLH